MKWLFFGTALLALAQWDTPPDVTQFLREAGGDLANAHMTDANREAYVGPQQFLSHFDPKMPGYNQLRDDVQDLTSRAGVASTIDIADDAGDEHRREMKLDWLLEIHDDTMQQDRPPRRELIKCTIEKHGKKWMFVAFEPVDFFKY